MATFIKGMTDQFGPMQLYRPDYQFLTQVYGTKQAQYDRGFDMVRSLYNSVLNSSLTNGDNQTFRQEAFKKLQGALKSVSNVDLSNQTNVMRAQGLIDPISQDQDLAYDMAVTKFHQGQKQKMEQYRNSTDPTMRAMYNDFSKMDIQFAEEDLRSAKRGDGSLQKIQPREFVPFEDTMEYLRKAAKEQGLEITQSGPDGRGYIIKQLNGSAVAPIFSEWAKNTMGNRFDRQFQVMGRVTAESAIRQEMSGSGISREAAIQNISQKLLPTLNEKVASQGIEADAEIKQLDSSIDLYERKYPNGFPPSEPHIKDDYQRLIQQREQRTNTLENSRSDVSKMQQEGPQYVAGNLYSIFTNEARERTSQSFGNSFATAKQSIEYRPDTTWATKAGIASREKVAAANLNFKYQNLGFQERKLAIETELKIKKLQADGKLPSEILTGTGLGQPQSGANLVSKAMNVNKEKVQLTAFNADNGLALLVLNEDSKKYGELQNSISKLQDFVKGSNKPLSSAEWNVINEYGKKVGLNVERPKGKGGVDALLDQLAGATYNTATKKLGEYSRMHKTSDSQKFVKAFSDASNAFKTLTSERENLNANMLRLSQEVVDTDGNIKEAYKGAKIIGKLATGGYNIDYSGISESARERLNTLVSTEYSARTRPVTNSYNFSKLNAAETQVLIKDPYSVKSIKASDGSMVDMETLKNLNSSDIAELFGDQADVFYDGQSAKVTLNLSQKTEISKKLGIKGTASLTFDLPYESIINNPSLSRFAKYVGPNSVSSQSLGVLDEFLTNPNARVLGEDSHLGYGFDYSVTGTKDANGSPALLFTMDFYNPVTRKNETLTQIKNYQPRNQASLAQINAEINGIFDNYIQQRVRQEQK